MKFQGRHPRLQVRRSQKAKCTYSNNMQSWYIGLCMCVQMCMEFFVVKQSGTCASVTHHCPCCAEPSCLSPQIRSQNASSKVTSYRGEIVPHNLEITSTTSLCVSALKSPAMCMAFLYIYYTTNLLQIDLADSSKPKHFMFL